MMTIALAMALAPQTPVNEAAEYFFIKPGVMRYYTSSMEGKELDTIDTVGEAELVGKEVIYPIITKVRYAEGEKLYYAIRDDGVYLVANWEKKAITPPMPILKVGSGEIKWSWKSDEMHFNYTSKPGKTRNVFGKDLPTIEFRAIGANGNDDLAVNVDQTAVYAKGVGMVEMTEVATTKKTKTTRTVKLTKITGGGW
jgi:hypothetical protein